MLCSQCSPQQPDSRKWTMMIYFLLHITRTEEALLLFFYYYYYFYYFFISTTSVLFFVFFFYFYFCTISTFTFVLFLLVYFCCFYFFCLFFHIFLHISKQLLANYFNFHTHFTLLLHLMPIISSGLSCLVRDMLTFGNAKTWINCLWQNNILIINLPMN